MSNSIRDTGVDGPFLSNEEILKLMDEAYEETKQIIASKDYIMAQESADGISLDHYPLGNFGIDCYRAYGYSKKPAKEMSEKLLAMTGEDWVQMQETCVEWYIYDQIEEDTTFCYQRHKLPWPMYDREFVTCGTKRTDENGVEYLFSISIEHKDKLRNENTVRAVCKVGAFVFLPQEDGGCKVVRLAQVHPSGRIPAFLVNITAGQIMQEIRAIKLW